MDNSSRFVQPVDVPWTFPRSGPPLDPRLDPYRDRVATLTREGHLLGYLLVVSRQAQEPPRGPLRRRRWEAEVVTTHVRFVDDESLHSDTLTPGALDEHLLRWAARQHICYGDRYDLRWFDAAGSARVLERLAVDLDELRPTASDPWAPGAATH